MRKFLSALLAVMMLIGVVAALPVSAADPVATFDGTVKADYENVDLIITEVMVNSKCDLEQYNEIPDTTSTSKTTSRDTFDFIEIYNRGDEAINLYEYSILRSGYHGNVIEYKENKTFSYKNSIAPGSIYNDTYGVKPAAKKTYSEVNNPSKVNLTNEMTPATSLHWLMPGQFAVIWFWTGDCDTVSTETKQPMAAPDTTRSAKENAYYFPRFRDFYNVPDETIVLAVYGQNSATNAPKNFGLDNHNAQMYALASADYDVTADPAITTSGSTSTLNSKIHSLFCWGVGTKAGIPTSDGTDHLATNYMPPIASPDLYNKDQKTADKNYVDAVDFVQTGHSISYKEMAIFRYSEAPTVGAMPLYQWAYIDPDRIVEHWDDLKDQAEDELPAVVRSLVYAEFEKQITDEVMNDGGIANNAKDATIKALLAAANETDGAIDQATEARLLDTEKYNADLAAHYADLLSEIVADYDEVVDYEIQDNEGNDTGVSLLFGDDNKLLNTIENGEPIWVSRLIDRFVNLAAYKATDRVDRVEEDIDVNLQDREDLEDKYMNNGGDSNKEWIPEQYETVTKLATWGLIVIIAGAVIGVAGIAVAVILVIKKKNKPVATDDVAAEGEVQIIDEGAEAPAENNDLQ